MSLSVLALGLLISSPSSAEILFVCGGETASQREFSALQRSSLIEPMRVSATPFQVTDGNQIALSRDAEGYDLLFDWNGTDETSLRESGAQIFGTGFAPDFVHLLVSYEEGLPAEHFIFSTGHDGLGNLVWLEGTSDSSLSPNDPAIEPNARCISP